MLFIPRALDERATCVRNPRESQENKQASKLPSFDELGGDIVTEKIASTTIPKFIYVKMVCLRREMPAL